MSRGRGHQGQDIHSAGGFAEYGHLGRVAAEGADVAPDPLQGGDLIHESKIGERFVRPGGRRQGGMGEESQGTQAIVDADQDHAVANECLALIGAEGPGADLVATAVKPHHHGRVAPMADAAARSPDIEKQAIFAGCPERATLIGDTVGIDLLRTDWAVLQRRPIAIPDPGGLRGGPAQWANRRGDIGYALESGHRALRVPDQAPAVDARPDRFGMGRERHRAQGGADHPASTARPPAPIIFAP